MDDGKKPTVVIAEQKGDIEQPAVEVDEKKSTDDKEVNDAARNEAEASSLEMDAKQVQTDKDEEEPVPQTNDSSLEEIKDEEAKRAAQVGAIAVQGGAASEKEKQESDKVKESSIDTLKDEEPSSKVLEQKQKDGAEVIIDKPKVDETMDTASSLGSSADSVTPTELLPSTAGRSTIPGAQSIQGIGASSGDDDDDNSFFPDTEAGETNNNNGEEQDDDMIQAELVKDVTAEAEILEEEDPKYTAFKRRRRRIFFGAGLCLVIISVVVAVSVSVTGSGGSTTTTTQFVAAPTPAPTFAPTNMPSGAPSSAPSRFVWDIQSVGPLEGEATEIVFSNFGDNVIAHDITDYQESLGTNKTTMIVATYGGSSVQFGRRERHRRNLRNGKVERADERRDFAFSDAKRLAFFFCGEGSCKEGLSIREGLFGPVGAWKIDISNDGRKMVAATSLFTYYYDFGRKNESITTPNPSYFGDPVGVVSAINSEKVVMNREGTFMAAVTSSGALFVYELIQDFGHDDTSGSGGGLVPPPPPIAPFEIPPDDFGGDGTPIAPCTCDIFGCSELDPLPIDPSGEGGIIVGPTLGCGFPEDQPLSMAFVPRFLDPEEFAEVVAIDDVTIAFGLQNRSDSYPRFSFNTLIFEYLGFNIHVYSVYGDKIGQTIVLEEGWSLASENGIQLTNNGTILAFAGIQNSTTVFETGTVFVYELEGDEWIPRGSPLQGLPEEGFGEAITLNGDGTILAIGAPRSVTGVGNDAKETGQVYTYGWSQNDWVPIGDGNLVGFADSSFGIALSMTESGQTLAVGSPMSDRRGVAAGDVHIFNFIGV